MASKYSFMAKLLSKAAVESMTPEQRTARARKAAKARWSRRTQTEPAAPTADPPPADLATARATFLRHLDAIQDLAAWYPTRKTAIDRNLDALANIAKGM